MDEGKLIFEMRGISKSFGATHALRDVRLPIRTHEVHAIMGENGAGKSTLMKILSGVYTPDAGEILLDGKPVKIANPAAARDLGINLIYQELSVAPHMTVAQNVFMGSEPRGRFGTVDEGAMNRRTTEMLKSLGARFSATTAAKNLSIAEQQQVEIGRALIHEGRILIMDEPTAALSDRETEQLFKIIEQLRDKGIAILYISHRMAEVHRLATRVTILRDGGYVGELTHDQLEPRRVVQMMVGRELGDFYAHAKREKRGPEKLRVDNLGGGKVKPATFTLFAGEVTGLAGLVGAGRTELARLIFGADQRSSGTVLLEGKEISVTQPGDAIGLGIGYVPEDRKSLGLFFAALRAGEYLDECPVETRPRRHPQLRRTVSFDACVDQETQCEDRGPRRHRRRALRRQSAKSTALPFARDRAQSAVARRADARRRRRRQDGDLSHYRRSRAPRRRHRRISSRTSRDRRHLRSRRGHARRRNRRRGRRRCRRGKSPKRTSWRSRLTSKLRPLTPARAS